MNTKSTFALLVVAAGLIAAALFYGRQDEMVISEAASPVTQVASELTSATIDRIEIKAPGEETVTLTRKDSVWYSNAEKQHRADKAAITGIFTAIEKNIEGEVVSTNPDSFADYLVDDTSGTRVQFYQSGKAEPVADLIIGKDGPAAFTTYVRKADAKEVVNARATLSYTFKKPDGWRDKTILEFPQDTAVRISGEGTSGTYEMVKEGSTWKLRKPDLGDAQPTKVNPILQMASTLRATEFVDRTSSQTLSEFGLDPPRQKIAITYEDKSTSPPKPTVAVLLLGEKKGELGQFYAKRTDSDDIYTISEHINTTLSPDPVTLALNPPAPPADAATTGTDSGTSAPAVEKPEPAKTASPEAIEPGAPQSAPAVSTPEPAPLTPTPSSAVFTPPAPAVTPVTPEVTTGTSVATDKSAGATPAVSATVSEVKPSGSQTTATAVETTTP